MPTCPWTGVGAWVVVEVGLIVGVKVFVTVGLVVGVEVAG